MKKKWGVFVSPDGRKYVSLIFTTEQEAALIPEIREAVGNGYPLPVQVLNNYGAFHSFQYEDCLDILEAEEQPVLLFGEEWNENPQDFSCGWISPEGDYYGCYFYLLQELAYQITLRLHDEASMYSTQKLLKDGWIRVDESLVVEFIRWPTDQQYRVLRAFGLHLSCSDSVLSVQNKKQNYDRLLKHDAFRSQPWFKALDSFVRLGFCTVADQEVFAVREALACLNMGAAAKRIEYGKIELSGVKYTNERRYY